MHAVHPLATQRGFVLIPVVLAITLIATIAFLLNNQSAINVEITAGVTEAVEVEHIVRSGLAHATWGVQNSGCAGDMGMTTVPFGQGGTGSYTATVTTPSGATTAYPNLTADQDAWIRSDDITGNNGDTPSNHLRMESGQLEYTLVRFDLSSVPAGAQINSAVARFYVAATKGHPQGPVTVHRVTADWIENGATWETMATHFDSVVLDTILAQPLAGDVWVEINLTAQVQAWVNSGEPNYGIILIPTGEGTHAEYMSRDGGANQRPRLDVIVGNGPASPATITATGTLTTDALGNNITRTLTRTAVPAYQPPAYSFLQLQAGSGKDVLVDGFYNNRNHGNYALKVSSVPSWLINTLVQFDLAALPAGARVLSAQLQLYHSATITAGAGAGARVHRVTRDWVEGTKAGTGTADGATWGTWNGSSAWATAGGDVDPAAIASSSITAATGDWESWDISTLVQGWLDGRFANNGLLLKGTGTVNVTFASKENADPTLHPKLSITYACECGSPCLAPQGSGTVMIVVVDPTNLIPADAYKKALFESWGYTVNLIGENANAAAYTAAAANNDVFYISESVNSSQIGTRIKDVPIGVVSEDGDYNSDLGLATGLGHTVGSALNVTDTSHYITALFPTGPLDIYSAAMEQLTVAGTEAPGLQTLADTGGVGSLEVLDKGASMAGGGAAAGRRVMLPLGRVGKFNWDYLNGNGRLIVQRALQWGTGNTGAPPKNLLLVVVNPGSLTAQEAAKKALMESWGYTVTLIDESASQGDFDDAVASADVAYVAEEITSGTLGTKLREATIGVVIEEEKITDEFGISSGETTFTEASIEVTDNTHYITEPFSLGAVTFASFAQQVGGRAGTLAPDLAVLALRPSSSTSMLDAIETGGGLFDTGTAAGRRVKLPWGGNGFDINSLTADGLIIMRRAIEWAGGAGCGSTKPLLTLVGDAANPTAEELSRKTLLESWCYSVSTITASVPQATYDTFADNYDVVYVPSSVNYADVTGKLKLQPVGVVNEVSALSAYLGFTSGTSGYTGTVTELTDNTHYITTGLTLGNLAITTISTSLRTFVNTMGPGLHTLSTRPSYTDPMIMTLDTGDELLWGGNAPDRRVMLPWGGSSTFDPNNLTADGLTILQRALEWAEGAGSSPGSASNVLVVVGDATTLSSADADRKALLESWGHTVTVIDDSDSQANFDAAAAAADVAYVTESVILAALDKKLKAATIGVVNEDPALHDVFGFSSNRFLSTANPPLTTDATHYITAPFGGATVLALFSSTQPLGAAAGTLPSGLQTIGTWASGTMSSLGGLLVLDTGAVISGGGTAAGRRVQLPWGGQDGVSVADINALTADGQTILQRALVWGAGGDTGGGGGGGGGSPPVGPVLEEFTEAQVGGNDFSINISKPGGTAAGDLLIAAVATDGNNTSSMAPPAGWNVVNVADRSGNVTLGVWWKLAGASESSSYTFNWSSKEKAYGWIMRVTGHDPITPINTDANNSGLSAAPTSPSVTTTVDNTLILRLGGFDNNPITTGAPGLSGHTPINMNYSSTGGSGASGGSGYVLQSAAGASGTSSFTLTASDDYVTVAIAIAPAP